jgi:hypothetical protein
MFTYQKGIEFKVDEKDVSSKHMKELENLIGKFLVEHEYINPKTHCIGCYDVHLNAIWNKY